MRNIYEEKAFWYVLKYTFNCVIKWWAFCLLFSGPAILRSRTPLRINEWTRVTATRKNREGTLVVNDDDPVTGKICCLCKFFQIITYFLGWLIQVKVKIVKYWNIKFWVVRNGHNETVKQKALIGKMWISGWNGNTWKVQIEILFVW